MRPPSDCSDYDSCEDLHGSRQPEVVRDPEVWADHYSAELVQAYHELIDSCSARGLALCDRSTFHSFVNWAFLNSSGWPPRV